MNFSKHLIFLFVAVLTVFTRQSNAGPIGEFFGNIASAVGNGVSAFIESLEKDYAESKQHRAYNKIKTNIERLASNGNNAETSNNLANGLVEVLDLVRLALDEAYDVLKQSNSMSESPEVIRQNLENKFSNSSKTILAAGIKFNFVAGTAAVLTPGATQGLNEATQVTIIAGELAFNGLQAAKSLAIQGIVAGLDAPAQSLLASLRSVQAIEEAILNLVEKAAEIAFAAINNNSLPLEVDAEDNSAKDAAAASSPKCQNAIESTENLANTASSQVTSEIKLKTIQLVRDEFINAIKTIAKAGKPGYESMDAAKNIPNQQLALETIEKGISESKAQCVNAIAEAQLVLGIAAQIIGATLEAAIVQAMQIVEEARYALMKQLDNSLYIASQGIKNNATEKATTAGHDAVATAGFSGYAELVRAVEFLFKQIVSA